MKNFSIKESQVVSASIDDAWEIVADIDNDSKYYKGLKNIKNISKHGNKVERQVQVGWLRHDARQIVSIFPKKSIVVQMTEGPLQGTRTMTLTAVDGGKTRIDVYWNVKPAGVPAFVQNMIQKELIDGTKSALQKIAYDLHQSSGGRLATRQ